MYNKLFFNTFGFTSIKGVLVGEHKGYTFSHTKYKVGYLSYEAISIYLGSPATKELIKTLSKRTKLPVYMVNYFEKNDTLIVLFPNKAPKKELDPAGYFDQMRLDVFQILEDFRYFPIQNCVICGKEKEEEVTRKVHKNLYVSMHEDCAKNVSQKVREEVAQDDSKSELLIGSILLSIFGAMIGMIPIVVLLFGAQIYLGILYFIPPFAAFFGFKLGKAPKNKTMLITIVAVCLLMVFLFEYMQWVIIAEYEEVALAELFAHTEIIAQAIRDFVLSFVFMGIGISVAWRYMMSKTNTTRMKEVEALED